MLNGQLEPDADDEPAGPSEYWRRVMEAVTHHLVVSDSSARGLEVAATIASAAGPAIPYRHAGLIVNRVRSESELVGLATPGQLDSFGWLPEDDAIRDADRCGTNHLELPPGRFTRAVARCLAAIGATS